MNDVGIVNRINRHPNVRCLPTSYIWVSATVASDKGSTTLWVRCLACVVRFVEPCIDEVNGSRYQQSWCRNVGIGNGL